MVVDVWLLNIEVYKTFLHTQTIFFRVVLLGSIHVSTNFFCLVALFCFCFFYIL